MKVDPAFWDRQDVYRNTHKYILFSPISINITY